MNWIEKWNVPSSSSNRTYVVSVADNGEWGCSCPSWKFHRRICKHIQHITESLHRTHKKNQENLILKTLKPFPKKEESEFISENEFSL
jgi:hypothetical protein